VLSVRLTDAIANVSDGFADAAIVSSDALDRWKTCAPEICRRNIAVVADLGLAGCCSMLLVAQDFENRPWKSLMPESYVVTSDSSAFNRFKSRLNIPRAEKIIERQGGTEPLAREIQTRKGVPVMIFDLVATGKSAFDNGYYPTVKGEESRVLLIRNAESENPELKNFCTRITERIDDLRQVSREVFLNTLQTAYAKETRPKPKKFLEERMTEIREAQP
jgi:ATP phosphoribosyltransferase